MEEQPSFEQTQEGASTARRANTSGFLKRVGRVLGICALGSLFYALLFGPRSLIGFADGLFIGGAILLVIALLPFINDIFGRSTAPFRMKDGRLEEVLDEERSRNQEGGAITYLFGFSGIIAVVLSFIITFVLP